MNRMFRCHLAAWRFLVRAAMLGAVLWTAASGNAQVTTNVPAVTSHAAKHAEEPAVLSAVGMRQVILALAPVFERETGSKVKVSFDSGAIIGRRVQGGEVPDIVIVPRGVIDDLVRVGRVNAASVIDVAAATVGLAVRKGSPKPDIASPEGLRRTLLAARSIARPDPARGGSSGVHIEEVLDRLGIVEQLRSRTILASNPERENEMPGSFVASGRAEIALHQLQELLAVPGVDVVGPLPEGLRGAFLFSAGVLTDSQQQPLAKQLCELLKRPDTLELIRKKGMEPASR